MPRIIKFILFLIMFGVFFEAGLIGSYTIVTSQPPDVGGLINSQIGMITDILKGLNINSDALTNKEALKITNQDPVADVLKTKAQLDGIDLSTLSASTSDNKDNNIITIEITATGYKENVTGGNGSGNGTGGQIVITPSQSYTITATAKAKPKSKGVEVDVNTIQIRGVKQVYTK